MCISGYVYVDLRSEEEVKKALKKNKDYIGDKHFLIVISLCVYTVYTFYGDVRSMIGFSGKNMLHCDFLSACVFRRALH